MRAEKNFGRSLASAGTRCATTKMRGAAQYHLNGFTILPSLFTPSDVNGFAAAVRDHLASAAGERHKYLMSGDR
jgi:hypothetical protein